MVASSSFTTLQNLGSKYAGSILGIHLLQILFIRSVVAILGATIKIKMSPSIKLTDTPRDCYKYMLLRCVTGFLCMYLFLWSMTMIPLSLASSIFYAAPIVTSILSYFFLGEKLSKLEVISIFSSLFGVILLSNPELLFPSMKKESEGSIEEADHKYDIYGVLLALCGTFFSGSVYVATRFYSNSVHPTVTTFTYAGFMALVSFLAILATD